VNVEIDRGFAMKDVEEDKVLTAVRRRRNMMNNREKIGDGQKCGGGET